MQRWREQCGAGWVRYVQQGAELNICAGQGWRCSRCWASSHRATGRPVYGCDDGCHDFLAVHTSLDHQWAANKKAPGAGDADDWLTELCSRALGLAGACDKAIRTSRRAVIGGAPLGGCEPVRFSDLSVSAPSLPCVFVYIMPPMPASRIRRLSELRPLRPLPRCPASFLLRRAFAPSCRALRLRTGTALSHTHSRGDDAGSYLSGQAPDLRGGRRVEEPSR